MDENKGTQNVEGQEGKNAQKPSGKKPQRVVTTKCDVNLRAEPSFKAAVVGTVKADSELTVLGEEANGWLKVDGGYTFGGNVRRKRSVAI
jgi:uncharacterized protein YgiM (DUF1202 family)